MTGQVGQSGLLLSCVRKGRGSCLRLSLLVLKVTVLVRERPSSHADSVHLLGFDR